MSEPAIQDPAASSHQMAIGLALAGAVITAWLAVHVSMIFFMRLETMPAWLVAGAVALQCWLSVGLFIVAHDCMHGALAPGHGAANTAIGTLCLALYACFDYRRLLPKHHLHHRHSGHAGDPDFLDSEPRSFWRCYARFFATYVSAGQLLAIAAVTWGYVLLLGAPLANVLTFWALPSILSSLQLFTFGTYLPHVPDAAPFADRHNARSNDYAVWLSLLTCFHFGYHHEHHLHPGVPWWRLPSLRAARRRSEAA